MKNQPIMEIQVPQEEFHNAAVQLQSTLYDEDPHSTLDHAMHKSSGINDLAIEGQDSTKSAARRSNFKIGSKPLSMSNASLP